MYFILNNNIFDIIISIFLIINLITTIIVSFSEFNKDIKITKNEEVMENDNYLKKEICYGEYSRKFYVGSIDENLIEANYNNGILMINIPKGSKIDNKKNIEIK